MSFILSKLIWVFIAPGNALVLLLLLGVFLAMANRPGWQNFGRKLCFNVAFLLFFIAIFPVGDWMLTPLENRFPPVKPEHIDGIVLLGGDEKPRITEARRQPTAEESMQRFVMFAKLVHEYPDAKLVYTGGTSLLVPQSKLRDADVAKAALAELGVPVDRMVFEDQSRNTHENATMTAAIVHPTADQKWLLVTSAWHMPRSMGSFRKAGWNVTAASTDYRTDGIPSSKIEFSFSDHLAKFTLAVHEYYGLLAYYLMGYTDTLWPQ